MENEIKFNYLEPEELMTRIQKKRPFFLVHTLTNDHFQKVHLPRAQNACVFEVTFLDQMNSITDDKNAEIVLCGSSGRSMDAQTAAGKLQTEGYHQIKILNGGIESWHAMGYPLEGKAVDVNDDPETKLILQDGEYRIDTDQSIIEWTGRNPNTTHFGNIKIASGDLEVKNGIITGLFHIDMSSITNINLEGDELQPVLIDHLKSDDFFLTKLFPMAKFKILSAKPVKEPYLTIPNYAINGALKLRGVEVQQDFMATVTKTTENGLAAEAHFDIDRTRWNIIYGSTRFFEHLGMHLVFDLISIQVRIVAFC